MRLDKYLKVSRLIKRRQLAKDASNSERILLNGKIAKPSKEVNIGDVITIIFGKKIVEVKITKLIDSTKKDDALLMYELISEKEKTQSQPIVIYKIEETHFGQLIKKIHCKIPSKATDQTSKKRNVPLELLNVIKQTGV